MNRRDGFQVIFPTHPSYPGMRVFTIPSIQPSPCLYNSRQSEGREGMGEGRRPGRGGHSWTQVLMFLGLQEPRAFRCYNCYTLGSFSSFNCQSVST